MAYVEKDCGICWRLWAKLRDGEEGRCGRSGAYMESRVQAAELGLTDTGTLQKAQMTKLQLRHGPQ